MSVTKNVCIMKHGLRLCHTESPIGAKTSVWTMVLRLEKSCLCPAKSLKIVKEIF